MKEDFLHYLWQYQLFTKEQLLTTAGEKVAIQKVGQHNQNSGPDFTDSILYIGSQLWAGSVEIHLKSSDWYVHHHENDTTYDAVILHVVWEEDMPVFRSNNTVISTLELKGLVPKHIWVNYKKLFQKEKRWIACEKVIDQVDSFTWNNWLERLYIERLTQKSIPIDRLLKKTINDWEAVLYQLLFKNFGLKVNGEFFRDLAANLDFSIVRKERVDIRRLEALFMGQAGLLNEQVDDAYYRELQKIYLYQQHKYKLQPVLSTVHFFRLRPPNFPTIRLSQLAFLFSKQENLFQKLIALSDVKAIYKLLQFETTTYWESHYVFGKESRKSKKKSSMSFLDLLLINTIIPIRFSYQKYSGTSDIEIVFDLIRQVKAEKNSIMNKYADLGIKIQSAMDSQALLTLKNTYCINQSCLSCAVGLEILKRNES